MTIARYELSQHPQETNRWQMKEVVVLKNGQEVETYTISFCGEYSKQSAMIHARRCMAEGDVLVVRE